jgi:hypothetical protein
MIKHRAFNLTAHFKDREGSNPLGVFTQTYDPVNLMPKTLSAPNGLTTTLDYHPAAADLRLKEIKHTRPGNVALSKHVYYRGVKMSWVAGQPTGSPSLPPAGDGTRRVAFLIPMRFVSDGERAVGGDFECGADGAGHLVGVGPEGIGGELDGGAAVVEHVDEGVAAQAGFGSGWLGDFQRKAAEAGEGTRRKKSGSEIHSKQADTRALRPFATSAPLR